MTVELRVKKDTEIDLYDLDLDISGRLRVVSDSDKLVTQLIRAVVSDSVFAAVVNESDTVASAVVSSTLKTFRATQVAMVGAVDPNVIGYTLYLVKDGTFERISPEIIRDTFTLSGLSNGQELTFGIRSVRTDLSETSFEQTFTATPTQFSTRWIIFSDVSVKAGNKQITFYVRKPLKFSKKSLLDKVDSVSAQRDTVDPRIAKIDLTVRDLSGERLILAQEFV